MQEKDLQLNEELHEFLFDKGIDFLMLRTDLHNL